MHTEGMVRVAHPGHGMGVEFPSRTPEQRAQVGNLIEFLRNCPATMLELIISPRPWWPISRNSSRRTKKRKRLATSWRIRCSSYCAAGRHCSRTSSWRNYSISEVPKKPRFRLSIPLLLSS